MFGLNSSLLDQLVFYGQYHNNKWNQLIHFIFVPMLMWSFLVWLSYTGPFPILQPFNFMGFEVNLNTLFVAAYMLYYTFLDFVAGLSWGIFVGLPLCISATAFCNQVEFAWAWALGAHLLGWYAQIHPGHAIFEKRRPALLDSFVQSIVSAPLFVWMELLFLFGYRPDLYRELCKRVNLNIQLWKQSQK